MTDTRFVDTDLPQGVEDVELAVFDGEAVLFRESTRMVHRLNAMAGSVWLLCDGATPVGTMADELGELFSVLPDDVDIHIYEALNQLAEQGLLVGFDAPSQLRFNPVDEMAPDGSRILTAPPDP